MTSIVAAINCTGHSIRCAIHHLLDRLTRKATVKIAITLCIPLVLKLQLDYEADIGQPPAAVDGFNTKPPTKRPE